ncbi:WD40-repeat-containing domain protein [Myxozyma melibiosi]|uniref:WD40-repeat-containing domain protein n=1 Tax=Myxozyma melibiosi TaxID=54550 RepID=A0ABR1FB04_9ASCO
MSAVPITREIISSFLPSKSFWNHKDGTKITSIDFDDSGSNLLCCGEDESLTLYDAKTGRYMKPLYSKKYGCHLARFTHSSTNCIHASTKEDDTIRYLSLHDSSYIRYFKGHKQKVIGLEMSPSDDRFISSSLDGTVRVWDLSSQYSQGMLTIPSPAFVAFDPAGVVFAVGCEATAEILLYDMRNFDREPFEVFTIEPLRQTHADSAVPTQWSKIEFSNDGKTILISTNGPSHFLIDAFTGHTLMRFTGHPSALFTPQRQYTSSGNTCISPDGRFVFSGSHDKKVYVWDIQAPVRDGAQRPIKVFDSRHSISSLAFNPRNLMLATADEELSFWLPDPATIEKAK